MKIQLPFGHGFQEADLPDDRVQNILYAKSSCPSLSQQDIVKEAMAHPFGGKTLAELSSGKKKIVIIASDHTRPVPSRIIIPLMLKEIRKGNPDAQVKILIATGCHRSSTQKELLLKFGEEIVSREEILIHDCDDSKNLKELGTLPSGGTLSLNRAALEADLLVAEGFIEPHFFAGFSGGPKSVLPGIASRTCVRYNHNAGFIDDGCSRTGMLEGNRIHEDMEAAARMAHLSYIVNVILDEKKEIVHAVAGEWEEAHKSGCRFLDQISRTGSAPADIVITTNGGYPLDQNIYQAVKGMSGAEPLVKKGGVIIMLAASDDGHGGDGFYRIFQDARSPEELMANFLITSPEHTVIDQWQAQILVRILLKCTIIFISHAPDDMVKHFHMIPSSSVHEAMAYADQIIGHSRGSITVLPDGVSVITSS